MLPPVLLALAPLVPPLGEIPPLTTELVADGFSNPILATSAPGDHGRLFVVEQGGQIRVVRDGVHLPTPFLDLTTQVVSGGERGLLGLVFHPSYLQNGRFFVFYNKLDGDTALFEHTANPPTGDIANPVGVELLSIAQPFEQHNGGMLAFGPDGMLYVSTGDGGSGADPFHNAQSLENLLGKILRIDVATAGSYSVPGDNPFVGIPGAQEEIWAYGLRNPWRMDIDPQTGDLWIGDVGQSQREEVDFIEASNAGANLGWVCEEGTLCFNDEDCAPCPEPGFLDPIHEYGHSLGCAITGGAIYRGTQIPELRGTYFFADYCTGSIWSLSEEGGVAVDYTDRTQELAPPGGGFLGLISAFGRDSIGELYIVSHFPGAVHRIVPEVGDPDCDEDGTPDAQEIAEGTAFDLNTNEVPDECELLLTVSDIIPGQITTIQFIGAQPQELVYFFFSFRGIGQGPCFFSGELCLDLIPFFFQGLFQVPLFAALPASAQGEVLIDLPIPPSFAIDEVALQAVMTDGVTHKKSNPVQKQVQVP